MTKPPLPVLFIGGHGRSGSTLLSRLLGGHPSTISVGELMFIGDRGFHENQLCSCGSGFRQCEFWTQVVALAAGGSSADCWFTRMAHLRRNLARIRYVPALAASQQHTDIAFSSASTEYVDMISTLFDAIAAVANVALIVDSSKYPPYGFFLSKCKNIDLYPAHLIRDSRAVAFSQQRKKVRPEIQWTTELMPRISPARSAFDWTLVNALMHLLSRVTGRHHEARYEDIVENPVGVSQELLTWVGLDPAKSTLTATQKPLTEHELSGNPMRFQRQFHVRPDVEWLTGMAARDHVVTTAVSAPLLLKYGYTLFTRRAQQAG